MATAGHDNSSEAAASLSPSKTVEVPSVVLVETATPVHHPQVPAVIFVQMIHRSK